MKKTIIKSPWGDFLKLQIGKKIYCRSAMGNFWSREGAPEIGFFGCLVLSRIASLTPVSEIEPDKFSDLLRATIPPERLGWMK